MYKGVSDGISESAKGARDARVDYVNKTQGKDASELEKKKWNTGGHAATGGYKGIKLAKTGALEVSLYQIAEERNFF